MPTGAWTTLPAAEITARPWPAGVAELLGRAEEVLQQEGPREAFDVLAGAETSPWVTNARGVCLLRLGEVQSALALFRRLAMAPRGFGLRHEAPTVFKTNYATAQLLAGNLTGCIVTLGQARDDGHPSVQRLRAAISHWRRSLSFREWGCSVLGGDVARPVQLHFPPGDL
jgi:hypothetical protein